MKGAKDLPVRPAGDDPVPVLTDDMAAVPVLTEVIPPPRVPRQRQSESGSTAARKARARVERDVRDRIADQEARLEETMAQLERVKAQASSVRDALTAEQQNRHQLEQQVNDLLTRQSGAKAADANAGHAAKARSVPESHVSRREMARQLAELRDYVACRKRWWEEMESLAESNRQRIRELEQEVAQRLQRENQAREVAEREQARAAALQNQLIEATREIEQLRRQLADIRLAGRDSSTAGSDQDTGNSS